MPTLPNADELEGVAGKWLLMKRGLYWRPNSQGYTGLKSEAGRYTDEEVAVYQKYPAYDVTVLDAETADEIAPKCRPDVAQRHLAERLSSAQTQIEQLTLERDEVSLLAGKTVAAANVAVESAEAMIPTPSGKLLTCSRAYGEIVMPEISMRERIAERLMKHYVEGGPYDGFMEADIVLEMLAEPTAAMAKHVAENAEHVSSPAHRAVLADGWARVFTAMIRAAQEGK